MISPENEPPSGMSRLRAVFSRVVAGRPHSDPLYLSNRPWWKKSLVWTLIGIPCLAVAGTLVYLTKRDMMDAPPPQPTAAEIAAKLLPDLNTASLPTNHEVELLDAHVDRATGAVVGRVRNRTANRIQEVEIIFNLTDGSGGQLGAVSVKIKNLAGKGAADFRQPVRQRGAVVALVREIRLR